MKKKKDLLKDSVWRTYHIKKRRSVARLEPEIGTVGTDGATRFIGGSNADSPRSAGHGIATAAYADAPSTAGARSTARSGTAAAATAAAGILGRPGGSVRRTWEMRRVDGLQNHRQRESDVRFSDPGRI